jgi:4-alpha-glucanotransferase
MKSRRSGVLLHITSLFSPYGIGDMGASAYTFADFLSRSKQSFWQILPLNPTDAINGNSPYSGSSAFAGNLLLISPDFLAREGFLKRSEMKPPFDFPGERVDYAAAKAYKESIFSAAYAHFKAAGCPNEEYEKFCLENSYWLDDFALFTALKLYFDGKTWSEWPHEIRDREETALEKMKMKFSGKIEAEKFSQYLFFKQWFSLKDYCNKLGISIIGDMPIYVNFDSSDVWKHPDIFKIDERKRPVFVSGVPPDYFSKTGQLWSNPVYNWEALKKTGYQWWIDRMRHALKLFDAVRIDHFRGLAASWEVPSSEKTAVNGKWAAAPVYDFLNTMLEKIPGLPIIAEDLGLITPDVKEVMRHFGFPGMKVLLFAFGEDNPEHPYLPHNYDNNCIVYTGTHDNNTVRGWVEKEASAEELRRLEDYSGIDVSRGEIHWDLIRLAMMSAGKLVIFPMQDILGLGHASRMNVPGVSNGNWEWRLLPASLTTALSDKLARVTKLYGRA